MIEWTEHFNWMGFHYETCDFGGLLLCFMVGNFSISYIRNPTFPKEHNK